MNLCILDSSDMLQSLSMKDRRTQHILKVLKKREGDRFRAGSSDGLIGWASLESKGEDNITLLFTPEHAAPPLRPVHLMLGTVRPIQAARIVKELTIIGVSGITFFPTELGEKSYTQSNFYTQKEYYTHAREGAEQAGNPRVPDIVVVWSLEKALERLEYIKTSGGAPQAEGKGPGSHVSKIVCHPDDSAISLSRTPLEATPVILAIGTERGWTGHEVCQFQENGFALCSLGDRILKTETASVVAATIVLARLGYF